MPVKDRRKACRIGLHALYTPHFDALCQILSPCWQPVSGLRSFVTQEALYVQGRTKPGDIVTWARPGLSYHNYGLATDWAFFREDDGLYIPLRYDDPLWDTYEQACQKVGLRCLESERPHNELPLHVSVKALLQAHERGGMGAVNELLLSRQF